MPSLFREPPSWAADDASDGAAAKGQAEPAEPQWGLGWRLAWFAFVFCGVFWITLAAILFVLRPALPG